MIKKKEERKILKQIYRARARACRGEKAEAFREEAVKDRGGDLRVSRTEGAYWRNRKRQRRAAAAALRRAKRNNKIRIHKSIRTFERRIVHR